MSDDHAPSEGETPKTLEELRAARPQHTPEPPPALIQPSPNLPAGGFAQRMMCWEFIRRRWALALRAWDLAATRFGDRPPPPARLRMGWRWESDSWLLTVTPVMDLQAIEDLAEWEEHARRMLKQIVTGDPVPLTIRFLTLDAPPPDSVPGITPAPLGLHVIDSGAAPRDWLAAHTLDDFGWESFVTHFGFLTEARPLTPYEREQMSRLAVLFAADLPGGTLAAMLARRVERQMWDAMRGLCALAVVPARVRLPAHPDGDQIDELFDALANWLHQAGRTMREETHRERVEDLAARAVPVGLAGGPDSEDKKPGKKKGKDVEAQMSKLMIDNLDAAGWSARQWADRIGCSKSSIVESRTWQGPLRRLKSARAEEEAERMERSRTAPKGRRMKKPSG